MDIYPICPKYDASQNSLSTQSATIAAQMPATGNETILLIQDVVPWLTAADQDPLGANVTELKAQGKNFYMINSSQIGSTNLSQYNDIIISAAQTQEFYDNLFPGGVIHQAIKDYVIAGGILFANLFDFASGPGEGGTWANYTFIGGIQHDLDFLDVGNNIADPNHPIITGDVKNYSGNCGKIEDNGLQNDIDGWNGASLGVFTNLLPGTKIILVNSEGNPVMIEYSFGLGRIIATLTTMEWRYSGIPGYYPQNKKLLANEISYQNSIISTAKKDRLLNLMNSYKSQFEAISRRIIFLNYQVIAIGEELETGRYQTTKLKASLKANHEELLYLVQELEAIEQYLRQIQQAIS